MIKGIHISLLMLSVSLLISTGCRRKVEEQPLFPAAEYYTPTLVAPASPIEIHGAVLTNSTVKIGGIEAKIDSVSEDGKVVYAIVPNELEIGSSYTVEVAYNDNENFAFTPQLEIAATSSSVKELLIGDFDGAGIRSANTTANFTNGQWSGNAGANSVIGIGSNVNGVEASPAGGNYAYATVFGGGILPATYGFVATISSRSGLQNDLVTDWPANFFEYPGSILNNNNTDLKTYYINFLVNFNDNPKSQLRIFIGSAKLPKNKRYAVTIKSGSKYPVTGWQQVSLAMNTFKDEFGFGKAMTFEDFMKLNQVDFDIADTYNNKYNACCTEVGSGTNATFINECCATAIKDPVQVYFDQVVISQGGPAPSIQ